MCNKFPWLLTMTCPTTENCTFTGMFTFDQTLIFDFFENLMCNLSMFYAELDVRDDSVVRVLLLIL